MYHYEKVLKHSDIVWFVSSACNLRRPRPECVGRVNRTFCFTGASVDVACVADALNLLYIYKGFRRVRGPAATQATVDVEGAVVRRPISA